MDGGGLPSPAPPIQGAAGGGGGPAEPERSAGAEETARDGKNWIETEREGQSRSGETGAVLESRERAEQPEGPQG